MIMEWLAIFVSYSKLVIEIYVTSKYLNIRWAIKIIDQDENPAVLKGTKVV